VIAIFAVVVAAAEAGPPADSGDTEVNAPSAPMPCNRFDVGGGTGILWYAAADGAGVTMAGSLAVSGGWQTCVPWLRVEAALLTSTRGPPWGSGVEAVEVAAWDIDTVLLGGISMPVSVSNRDQNGVPERSVGIDALLGPDLRLTRTSVTLREQTSMSDALRVQAGTRADTAATLRLWATFGGYLEYRRWRLGLRAHTFLPWDAEIDALMTVAHAL